MTTQTLTVRVPKSIGLSYVLWFFLGNLGVHRFYLGRIGTGIVQLILAIIGAATVIFGVGFVFLGILWLWLIIDLFLIPGMARSGKGMTVQATSTSTESPGSN